MHTENKTYLQKIIEIMANKNIKCKKIEGNEKFVVAYMRRDSAIYRCYFDDLSTVYLQVYSIIDLPIPKDKEIELRELLGIEIPSF